MGCLDSIFKMWPDKNFVQREKNTGLKDHEESFQVKQHSTGFIGSADDSTEPGVQDNSQVFSGGNFSYCLCVG